MIHNLDGPLTLKNQYEDIFKLQLMASQLATPLSEITTGRYQIMFGSTKILSDLLIESGGVYTLVLQKVHSKIVGNLHTITPPAQLHILWMVPQIIVMAISEIFFSVTYLSFTFNEAPVRMKSIISSISFLAISLGNVIVVLISSAKLFNRQVYQFLFYAGLMVLNTVLLIFLSVRYKYRDQAEEAISPETQLPPDPENKTGFDTPYDQTGNLAANFLCPKALD
ncbi:peptide transporter family 1-like [Bemisia tabaci]